MLWKLPPRIKIYEALGCIADGRITMSGNTAKVLSSSGRKAYGVRFDPSGNAIMANDNGSFWQGYMGYPAIAFLMKKKILSYHPALARALKGTAWKDLNTKFNNDFKKTERFVLTAAAEHGIELREAQQYVRQVLGDIRKLKLRLLGKKVKPPTGY